MLEGFIWDDPMGDVPDGTHIRISNIEFVLEREDYINVATRTQLYRLPKNEEKVYLSLPFNESF